MSLATDFLADYIERSEQTQTDFARAAGMTPTNITEILKGTVNVSGRNLANLLRGIRDDHERDAFLAAYLRDNIPTDMADRVQVHLTRHRTGEAVMEGDDRANLEAELVLAFATLPNETYRRRVVRFLQQLRRDAELRDLFRRTMEYVDDDVEARRESSHRADQVTLASAATAANPAGKPRK